MKITKRQVCVNLWCLGSMSMIKISRVLKISRERVRQILEGERNRGVLLLTVDEWRNKRLQIRKESFKMLKVSIDWENSFGISNWRRETSRCKLKKNGIVYSDGCEFCGWGKGLNKGLHIHHIDKNRNHNNIDNLIILCPNCHWTIHCRNNDFDGLLSGNNKELNKRRK